MTSMHDQMTRTRDVILERGWTAGSYTSPEGAVCLFGAFNIIDHGTTAPLDDDQDYARRTRAFAQTLGFQTAGQAVAWNDHMGERVVIDRLKRTAETLEHTLAPASAHHPVAVQPWALL